MTFSNQDAGYSKTVLCFNNGWGVRFGYYIQSINHWVIEGVKSSNGVFPEYWKEIELPDYE